MNNQKSTWDEWLESLSEASFGRVDYGYLDEESAKAHHPILYDYYITGCDVVDLLSERLMSYEGGDVVIWLDPDDDDADDDQLQAILANTEFYGTFSNTLSSLRVLNNIAVPDFEAQKTLKRQIFVSSITCLETYLSDAFVNTVLSNKKYLKNFFRSFKDFRNQKLGMNELFDRFEKADEIAKKAMSEVTYHNLPKVSNMYKSVFNMAFPDFSKIQSYIAIRHDLVHRNGKTKEGQEIPIDGIVVNKTIDDIKCFVAALDQDLKDQEKTDFLDSFNIEDVDEF